MSNKRSCNNQKCMAMKMKLLSGGFEHLPLETLLEIITRLPISSLGRLKCTCKFWCKFLIDSDIVDLHLCHSIRNPGFLCALSEDAYYVGGVSSDIEEIKPFDVSRTGPFPSSPSGSSGGLLAYYPRTPENIFHVCNPITKEHVKLPPQDPKLPFELTWGFSYSSTTKEYKIVRFGYGGVEFRITSFGYTSSHLSTRLNIDINFNKVMPNPIFCGATYTLGSESWRELSHVPYPPWGLHVDFNGTLFWLIWNCFYDGEEMVMSFNIDSQKFKALHGPPIEIVPTLVPLLMNIANSLTFVIDNLTRTGVEIWVLVDEEKGVWMKRNNILMDIGWNVPLGSLWEVHLVCRFANRQFFPIFDCARFCFPYERFLKYPLFRPWSEQEYLNAIPHSGSLVSPRQIAGLCKRESP